MGSASRIKPERLGEKLLAIRKHFGDSAAQMAKRLSDANVSVQRTDISRFETGIREPNLLVLLKYARLINEAVDVLIDDEIDLLLD